MTPENRILLEKIFSEISYKDHDNIVAENAALQEDNANLQNEIRELTNQVKGLQADKDGLIAQVDRVDKERGQYLTNLQTLGWKTQSELKVQNTSLLEDNANLQNDNAALIAENIKLQEDAGSLKADRDWERANPKLGKVVAELKEQNIRLQADIEKLNIIIKDLKADCQKWYTAFNSSQGMCLDFITQNRLIREQLHGLGKVTAV